MKTKAATVILTSMLLSACGAKPVIPYVEPDGVATAKLRIVTNGQISGAPYGEKGTDLLNLPLLPVSLESRKGDHRKGTEKGTDLNGTYLALLG